MSITFLVDASPESGADFFYDIINAPTQNWASLFSMMSKSQFRVCEIKDLILMMRFQSP